MKDPQTATVITANPAITELVYTHTFVLPSLIPMPPLLIVDFILNMSSIIARSASDLQALGCPAVLCDEAWAKIIAEQFDAGNYVQFGMRDIDESNSDDVNSESNEVKAEDVTIEGLDDEEQESEVPEVRGSEVSAPSMYSLHAKDGLKAFSTVMLIDHMW